MNLLDGNNEIVRFNLVPNIACVAGLFQIPTSVNGNCIIIVNPTYNSNGINNHNVKVNAIGIFNIVIEF